MYENGATVRSGIEIEGSSPVRTLQYGEVVEGFKKAYTREGIGRFQIADGWISERLRGGREAKVVQVLWKKNSLSRRPNGLSSSLSVSPSPSTGSVGDSSGLTKVGLTAADRAAARAAAAGGINTHRIYKVLRPEGARVREECLLNSKDMGFCPEGTLMTVGQVRYLSSAGAVSHTYTVYTICYILYAIYYILYTIYYILYTIYYILYTIYYILYTIYYILYTMY
jgi:hypothetical protein